MGEESDWYLDFYRKGRDSGEARAWGYITTYDEVIRTDEDVFAVARWLWEINERDPEFEDMRFCLSETEGWTEYKRGFWKGVYEVLSPLKAETDIDFNLDVFLEGL